MMKISKNPFKDWPDSFPGDDALFNSLIITDLLAPFFIWPHWTGYFYPGWAVFFSSGLAHWLQALALLLAWPILRTKLWGRLGLGLLAGLHVFLPPPTLDDQAISGLAATMAWWLAALPAVLATSRGLPDKPPADASKDTGSKQFQIITCLALAANPILILAIVHPFLGDPLGLFPNVGWAALQEMAIFLVLLLILFLAGRCWRLFSAPIYLAALVSLGGILWLWADPILTEAELDAFLTGLIAIHITLLPAMGAVVLVGALVTLILHRVRENFSWPAPPVRPGWLLALVLMPPAGLGLMAFPLWADHLSRSYLAPRGASGPASILTAGPLSLSIPASLKVASWVTFINWAANEKSGEPDGPAAGWTAADSLSRAGNQERPRPWREVHGMVLIESEYANPSLAEQEFEAAWERLLGRASDHPGFPRITNDLSEQFGRPSRLLIHYHSPRQAVNRGSMIMRLTFLQRQSSGYIQLAESANIETNDVDPAEIDDLKDEKRAEFLGRVEEVAAAYRWGRWLETSPGSHLFMTRFGRLDPSRLQAELETTLSLLRAGESDSGRRRGRNRTEVWIRSRSLGDSGSTAAPANRLEETASADSDSSSRSVSERLEPLLGWIDSDRIRSLGGRSGLEKIRIITGGRDNSPSSIKAIWSSFEGELEVEMWSDQRLVQAELPVLTRFWEAILEGPDPSADIMQKP